jgi:GMP synthase (glutamine-hydrolysing)
MLNRPFLIIKTGSTMPELKTRRGDFEDWILQGLDISSDRALVVDVSAGEKLPNYHEISGLAITGSHAMVTEQREWSETTAAWLAVAAEKQIPTLGICYGHQLLAHGLGGAVDWNPKGREVGTIAVTLHPESQTDSLFAGLPEAITVNLSHRQTVLELPPDATLLASSTMADHIAFRYGENVWGLQFHPEFDRDVMQSYIRYAREGLLAESQDPDTLLAKTQETPQGLQIMARFAALVA